MLITETITINRSNTSIDWPSSPVYEDPNDPWPTANVTTTSAISDDSLTKTIVRTWTSKEEFITVHTYLSPYSNGYFYFNSITIPGLTHTRTFLTTEQ